MKNKIYFLLIIITGVFYSCDSTDDCFSDDNTTPEIDYKAVGETSYTNFDTDSAKLSEDHYDLYFSITDEETLDLNIETDLRYEIDSTNSYVRFALDDEGTYPIVLSCTDGWNVSDSKSLDLIIYDNLIPVASLSLTQIDGREYKIDASDSYDQDQDDGGEIALYRYYVNDIEIDKTYHSSIKYIFPENDTYEVSLQVKDNDDQWSEITSQTITITQE